MTELHWVSLPFEGAPVSEVVIIGSGKDTDLTIRLTDGRAIELPVDDVRLIAHDGVMMDSMPKDDVSRILRISGPDLSLRRAAVAWPGQGEPEAAEVAEDVREAIQVDGQRRSLSYVVNAELELERPVGSGSEGVVAEAGQ